MHGHGFAIEMVSVSDVFSDFLNQCQAAMLDMKGLEILKTIAERTASCYRNYRIGSSVGGVGLPPTPRNDMALTHHSVSSLTSLVKKQKSRVIRSLL